MEGIGTAVGIISLGMQLYQSTSKYIDGLKCASLELASTARQLEMMHNVLESLSSGLGRVGPLNVDAEHGVRRCVVMVKDEMDALDTLLEELKSDGTEGLRERLRDKKKKLSYPFHRPALQKLERRLTDVNAVLSNAVHAMHL